MRIVFGKHVSMTNENQKDIFGFADAIQIEHLNDEQLKIVEEIFKNFK